MYALKGKKFPIKRPYSFRAFLHYKDVPRKRGDWKKQQMDMDTWFSKKEEWPENPYHGPMYPTVGEWNKLQNALHHEAKLRREYMSKLYKSTRRNRGDPEDLLKLAAWAYVHWCYKQGLEPTTLQVQTGEVTKR